MKEFVEKLLNELNYQKEYNQIVYDAKPRTEHEKDLNAVLQSTYDSAIRIVKRLAGEYERENLIGWIPCSERLPELTEGTECFKQSKCCLVTLKWWDGDMTESVGWYNQSGVWSDDSNNCKVLAWQPLPEPYQPKGE